MTLQQHTLPELRRSLLRSRLQASQNIRLIEAHNGMSALVAGTVRLPEAGRGSGEFDGLWISSLTSSASRGLPDMEIYLVERRLELIEEICAATGKIVVVDGDTGGDPAALEYLCCRLEALGVCAIVIEDKQHPKRNSLSLGSNHVLEQPQVFAAKLARAKAALRSKDFMIFARLESLIAGETVADALDRARCYLLAGADGVMIHSKSRSPQRVFEFLAGYRSLCTEIGRAAPVICVPTTYNTVTAQELFDSGVSIVIHANHLLRAAHFAMRQVCVEILRNDRTLEADNICTPVSEIFRTVGYDDALARESHDGAGRLGAAE